MKLSVIVPTFNGVEEKLNRIVTSFDKQTMSQKDFEVIFVDDGSSNLKSYYYLKNLITKRPNFYIFRISPSGWASRPRNYGLEKSKGEYVFYCDDDDTVFPQAFERMYDFAKKNDLDVVNPKVTKTKGWSWGWEELKETKIVSPLSSSIKDMIPMTVPKLYKRKFLLDNNIKFPEGSKVWWEDIMYSCLVFSHAPRIGIYADYPIYHWREQTRSARFGNDINYKWKQMTRLCNFFIEHLDIKNQQIMLTHWYNSRVINAIGKNFHKKSSQNQLEELEGAYQWLKNFGIFNITKNLGARASLLKSLIEKKDIEGLIEFSKHREDFTARSYLDEISFSKDAIDISCSTILTHKEESNVKISGSPNKPKVHLSSYVKKNTPKKLHFYKNADLSNSYYRPILKGRFTRSTWEIKNVHSENIKFQKKLNSYNVSASLKFSVKISEYLQDAEDAFQPFDIATRFHYLDFFSQRGIACKETFKKTAIINGHTIVAYKNNSSLLSLDLNSHIFSFFNIAKLDINNLSSTATSLEIPIHVDHVYGESVQTIPGLIYNSESIETFETDIKLITKNNHAKLVIEIPRDIKNEATIDLLLGIKSFRMTINF